MRSCAISWCVAVPEEGHTRCRSHEQVESWVPPRVEKEWKANRWRSLPELYKPPKWNPGMPSDAKRKRVIQ